MQERYIEIFRGINYLEEIMGAAWLKEMLKQLKAHGNGGAGFGRGIDFSSCGLSPVAYYWYRAREELALAGIKGDDNFGLNALYAAVIAGDLMALAGSDGLKKRIEGLKDPARAVRIQNELCIASGYVRNGHRVDFSKRDGFFITTVGREINVAVTCMDDTGNGIEDGNGHFEVPHSNITGQNRAAMVSQMATIKYVYLNETPGAGEDSLNKPYACTPGLGESAGLPGVIFGVTPMYISRIPVIIRSGKLVNPGGVRGLENIYVPGEKLMPARY